MAVSTELRMNYSHPFIGVLFEPAADTCTDRLAGIILTGANPDGTNGAARIKGQEGLIIVQAPETAGAEAMPMSEIKHVRGDHILPLIG